MEPYTDWLLQGDVSLHYLTRKYLLEEPEEVLLPLRRRIAVEGWGKAFLEARHPSGHWGKDFYQPKWTSSHYTLLDLRHLEMEPVEPIRETLQLVLEKRKFPDGSIHEAKTGPVGDLCVNGMFLNYASFFGLPEEPLRSVVDYLLDSVLEDGGFNCYSKFRPVRHSSLHSTLSVLEGFLEFLRAGHTYRLEEIRRVQTTAQEFILRHRLYRSDHTGEIIDPKMLLLSFPPRWHYDILRALVYFADARVPYDPRMTDALQVLLTKRGKDGHWPLQGHHPGKVHFEMESPGDPSRFNTLRALQVLRAYGNVLKAQ